MCNIMYTMTICGSGLECEAPKVRGRFLLLMLIPCY